MDSMQLEEDINEELKDDGSINVEPPPLKPEDDNIGMDVGLLDLSDDVLLCILKYCSPQDLKALGFSCSRLARLVLEKSLWRRVDVQGQPCGKARLRWLVTHALNSETTHLYLTGYAKECDGCLGLINTKPKETDHQENLRTGYIATFDHPVPLDSDPFNLLNSHYAHVQISSPQSPRFISGPFWPENADIGDDGFSGDAAPHPSGCTGPRFTVTADLMAELRVACCNLTVLELNYCNINCRVTTISQFPPTLKKLSLRGSKCYNLPVHISFLFRIQDYLPKLECMDVSECEWMEPSALLPLSKLAVLRWLVARDCPRFSEFVAYASLASRYGFRSLEEIDLRGCPVGDPEVSGLAWLPVLRVIRLAASHRVFRTVTHTHYKFEPWPARHTLQDWELEEPECYRFKTPFTTEAGENVQCTSDEGVKECPEGQSNTSDIPDNNKVDTAKNTDGEIKDNERNSDSYRTKRKPDGGSGDTSEISGDEPSSSYKRKKVIEYKDSGISAGDDGAETSTDYFVLRRRRFTSGPACITVSIVNDKNKETEEPSNSNELLDENDDGNTHNNGDGNLMNRKSEDESGGSCEIDGEESSRGHENRADENDMETSRDVPVRRFPTFHLDNVNVTVSVVENQNDKSEDQNQSNETPNGSQENKAGTSNVVRNDNSSIMKENFDEKNENKDPTNQSASNPNSSKANDGINDGASTSNTDNAQANNVQLRRFICFHRNRDPIVREIIEGDEEQREPLFRVLYMNFKQPLVPGVNQNPFGPLESFFNNPPPYVDSTTFVTDSSVQRFGHSDNENINYVYIGINGPIGGERLRQERTNLRRISMVGYRYITDRSLEHLATAAPYLEYVDFRGTSITPEGVKSFRRSRPDCEVLFGEIMPDDEDTI